MTSQFWQKLGRQHASTLTKSGFENFKISGVNSSYFDWPWAWLNLHRSPCSFLLFLWRNTTLVEKIRAFDVRLYHAVTKLAWQYAWRNDRCEFMKAGEPLMGNPIPVRFQGRIVSQDLANSSLELNFMFDPGETPRAVLEIGAGYGRTAYALMSKFQNCKYMICDIEPALSLSRWYLTQLFPKRDITFVTPEELGGVPDKWATHGISISTLPEYTREIADEYLRQLNRVCDRVYLKQWADWHNPVDGAHLVFDSFKLPNWKTCKREVCPIQVKFSQAVYEVPRY